MYYPWWYIPGLTGPMLIAIVAVVHVIVAHYAVGGGILLARENSFALKKNDLKYRNYWKKHLKFFVLLTVVFGAITGVGIWWTIGLTSPLATEMLIRTFVFGWAIEWCFFIMEIVAAFAFYYYWDKLRPKAHRKMGWIYAWSAWISLVLITGITAFMLNSKTFWGKVESPDGLGTFWQSFLNLQFIPQTIMRTGAALILATFYVYCHATLTEEDDSVREQVVQRMRLPSFAGITFLFFGVVGWFFLLSPSSRLMLEGAAVLNLFLGLFAAIVAGMTLLMFVGPIRAPRKMSFAFSLALLMFGIAGVAVGEFIREAVRKPFIVDRFVYGNQIYVEDAQQFARNGYLASGVWTSEYLILLQKRYPDLSLVTIRDKPIVLSQQRSAPTRVEQPVLAQNAPNRPPTFQPTSGNQAIGSSGTPGTPPVVVPRSNSTGGVPAATPTGGPALAVGTEEAVFVRPVRAVPVPTISVNYPNLLRLPEEERVELGKVLFMYHCNDCHAPKRGYSAVGLQLTAKTKPELVSFVQHLNRPGYFMPPWCGNDAEAQLLADYLITIRPDMPDNLVEAP